MSLMVLLPVSQSHSLTVSQSHKLHSLTVSQSHSLTSYTVSQSHSLTSSTVSQSHSLTSSTTTQTNLTLGGHGFHYTLISSPWQHCIVPQVPLPTINSRAVRILLQYLYTGRCLFTHDDLNLGLDLLATADRFLLEPMRLQCERALSEKIDAEVCVLLSCCKLGGRGGSDHAPV